MKKLTPNKIDETAVSPRSAQVRPSCAALPDLNNAAAPPPGLEGFISREELARLLHKSIRTIANWQRRGLIPFVKIENSTWINLEDVQKHLDRNFRVCRKEPHPSLVRIPVIAMAPDPKPKEQQ
jgi:hypothetical protein